jgi:hypothetical protein
VAALNAALARQARAIQKADTDAKRLAAADQTLARGDVRVACLIYARVASARPLNPSSEAAKLKISELQSEAKKKLEELDSQLMSSERSLAIGGASPGKAVTVRIAEMVRGEAESARDVFVALSEDAASSVQKDRVLSIFREYDRLVDTYGDLPGVGSQIRGHVTRLRRQPEYASVLNESAAAKLWEAGQSHERDDQLCCAYWVYKRAAELAPAPSAMLARFRFTEMEQDPKVVAAAETCRELKWCHQAYLRAERLQDVKPEKAAEVFAEIVRRAPEDSEVYRAAKEHIR